MLLFIEIAEAPPANPLPPPLTRLAVARLRRLG